MIGSIKGEILRKEEGNVLLECGGIGYEIAVSNTTLTKLTTPFVHLFTYLSVRDDGLYLYGFHSQEEKTMFLKLTSISGIGPKVALGILSGIELNNLMIAIITSDTKTLSKIKGIGKKTAERIILELRESLNTEGVEISPTVLPDVTGGMDRDMIDAVSALRGLGVSQIEAVEAVKKAKLNAKTLEELISFALRNLN